MTKQLRMGTRRSALALGQAGAYARLLEKKTGCTVETVEIVTKGDTIQDRALSEIGGKGLFISGIEEALLANEVDFAVHSLKDMPYALATGLCLASIPAREDPRDVLLGETATPKHIGTGSPRRTLQLQKLFPQARFSAIRGNIDTRIRAIGNVPSLGDAKQALDAVVLAAAGLNRLNAGQDVPQRPLTIDESLPSAGQGLLGIECRKDDASTRTLLAQTQNQQAMLQAGLERLVLRRFEADCTLPVAAYALPVKQGFQLHVGLFSPRIPAKKEVYMLQGTDSEALREQAEKSLDLFLAEGGQALLQDHQHGN